MQSSGIERHIDRQNGAPNQRPMLVTRRKHLTGQKLQKLTLRRLGRNRQKQKDNCDLYAAALATAQQVVWDQAEALHENFGKHDTKKIIQCSHKKITERPVSRWNTFLSLKLERCNKGL